MKRILIIMGNHSPVPSSVANCMEPIIKKMVGSFEVDIVTDRKRIDVKKYERKNGVNIYRIDDYRTINTIVMNEAQHIEAAKLLRILTRLFCLILKGCYYVRYILFAKEKGTGGWQTKEIVKRCVELHSERKYTAVISISQPFKSHYIAEKFINVIQDNIKWFIFEFDPFSFNDEIKMSKKLRNRVFKDEYRVFDKCDNIFLTPELYTFYKKTPFDKFIKKAISVPFANLEPIEYKEENVTDINLKQNRINCLFAGRIYKDIRNPKYALEVFSKLNKDIHFTAITNYSEEIVGEDISYKIINNENTRLSIFPLQSRDTALYMMLKTNILVNIGNTVEFQVPGKIFEYMSTGKPIIHFSKFSEDPALFYLKKYPLVFVVNEWEKNPIEYIRELEDFCEKHKNSQISFQQVSELLGEFEGESVANGFVGVLAEILEDIKRNYE